MNYCPRCGSELVMRLDGGRDRPACAKDGCGFVHFGHHSIGCGGVVIRDNKALLVQRGINPNRGAWQIPGGYVESDEEIVPAVEREVLEEAGVVAKVSDVIGVRHTVGVPTANVYVVFRLDLISGEPRFDGVESIGAGTKALVAAVLSWRCRLSCSSESALCLLSSWRWFVVRTEITGPLPRTSFDS